MMRYLNKTLALLALSATVGMAQQPQRGGRGRGMVQARQAIERLIRNQVQPNDDQMVKLRQIDQRFMARRVDLDREEQQVRKELRRAMLDTANVDQNHIGQLLDRTIGFPGRRAALMEEEQKALGEVLTPLQRAKYHAIQEQLRKRIEQGRGQQPGRGRPPQFPE
jgi:Spy/CpxP family protein refolding chaperone